jgi:hypothetical protein
MAPDNISKSDINGSVKWRRVGRGFFLARERGGVAPKASRSEANFLFFPRQRPPTEVGGHSGYSSAK